MCYINTILLYSAKKIFILIMRFNKNLYIFLIALRKYVAMWSNVTKIIYT